MSALYKVWPKERLDGHGSAQAAVVAWYQERGWRDVEVTGVSSQGSYLSFVLSGSPPKAPRPGTLALNLAESRMRRRRRRKVAS